MMHLRLRFSHCLVGLAAVVLVACNTAPLHEPVPVQPAPAPASAVSVLVAEPVKEPPVAIAEPMQIQLVEENNIFFASAATEVDDDGAAKLRLHAERLKDDPEKRVLLVGHTDDLGSRNYNLALAEERILSVSKLLRRYGVSPRQIRRYRGDSEKVQNSCKSPECRQKMRRVELVYPPTK